MNDAPHAPLTAFEWLAAVGAALVVTAVAALSQTTLAPLFRELASPHELPLLTQLVMSRGFPIALGVLAIVPLACATLPLGTPPRHRWRYIAAAFGVGIVGLFLYFVAMYWPIFSIAESIKE
jgi:hypothetical protein